jgi:glycosyltransferase involved in cell wall biosynthesis
MKLLLTADPELPVPPKLYGGIERIIADLILGLRQRGHEVALAAHPDSTVEVDRFYPWRGAASQRLSDTLKNSWILRRAVADFQPDLLHSFSRLMYLLPLLPGRLPKLMSYQRQPSRRTTSWARRLAGGRLQFTGCSEHICRTGRRGGGRWTAIPNFVDVDRYTFQPSVAADAPLVFLSRIEPIKGCHLAIEAARRSGRRLLIAGNHAEEGENGRYWREQILPHLGRDGIEYVGPVDDRQKNALLGQAAAMLVPVQWEEPFGIVFVEALACGTPVISCPRGALPEIVRNAREGFLCQTVEEMINAIGQLTSLKREDCRRRVEEAFARDAVVTRYESVYEQLRAREAIANR